MKTKYIHIILLACLISFSACVEDTDFDVPNVTIQEPVITGNETSFQAVVAAYNQAVSGGDNFVTFDTNLYITGYVISNDQAGNFFEELIIQNSVNGSDPANGGTRLGFKVEINVPSLYNTYQFGRKVYIKLNGLSFGESNGVYVIGKGAELDQIQAYEYRDFVIRSAEVATIEPKITTIDNLTAADENTFVQLDDVQFNRDMIGLTYAGEQSDEFDGFRILESCAGSASIPLQTSTFSDFKSLTVAPNRGSIQGIFSRDFRDDFNVFIINTPNDIDFNDTNRCDPIELNCGLATAEGTTVLFDEDFETMSAFSPISGNGWTNYIEAGTESFEAYTSGGSNASQGVSCRVGSFRSGDASSVAWLITPPIDLDGNTGVTLSFETSNSFSDGSELELLFSPDWDGDPNTITSATWGIIPAAYITQDNDSFASWFDSGIVDLSCGTGNSVYFAFKYTGSGDAGFDGTYEIDNIKIRAN